ncbi:MAG: nucleotidyltransferase domain-containing protein [Nanoarchaeota archaeon]|nr:nucleotidyltransferase domain-containing protein [Nanoarchaeota archaeon]
MLQNLNNTQMKIISELIFKKYYLRELSKRINEIPSTVLRNLNQMEKDKIIESYHEGKNKYFFLPKRITSLFLIKLAEDFRTLAFFEKHKEKIALFNDILKSAETSTEVILFGSFAKGIETKESDLDILVKDDKNIKSKIINIEREYGLEINPKIIKSIDFENLVIKEVIAHHIILKGGEFIYEQLYKNLAP